MGPRLSLGPHICRMGPCIKVSKANFIAKADACEHFMRGWTSWEGMWLGSFWGFSDVGLLSFSASIFSLVIT